MVICKVNAFSLEALISIFYFPKWCLSSGLYFLNSLSCCSLGSFWCCWLTFFFLTACVLMIIIPGWLEAPICLPLLLSAYVFHTGIQWRCCYKADCLVHSPENAACVFRASLFTFLIVLSLGLMKEGKDDQIAKSTEK